MVQKRHSERKTWLKGSVFYLLNQLYEILIFAFQVMIGLFIVKVKLLFLNYFSYMKKYVNIAFYCYYNCHHTFFKHVLETLSLMGIHIKTTEIIVFIRKNTFFIVTISNWRTSEVKYLVSYSIIINIWKFWQRKETNKEHSSKKLT